MCTGNQPHGFPLRTELFRKQRPSHGRVIEPVAVNHNLVRRQKGRNLPLQSGKHGLHLPAEKSQLMQPPAHTAPAEQDTERFAPHFRVQRNGGIGDRGRFGPQANHMHARRHRFCLFRLLSGMAGADDDAVKAGSSAQFFCEKILPIAKRERGCQKQELSHVRFPLFKIPAARAISSRVGMIRR